MPTRKLPPNREVLAMYRSGMSSGEIADRTGTRPITVVSLLRRLNEPRRNVTEAARLRSKSGRANTPKFWLGKKQPRDMVEKRISKIRGERHYLWKDGKSRRHYRTIIKKERCVQCSSHTNLVIHHIDFDHYNDKPENLETRCGSCHTSIHKKAYWMAIHERRRPKKSNTQVEVSGVVR